VDFSLRLKSQGKGQEDEPVKETVWLKGVEEVCRSHFAFGGLRVCTSF